MDLPYRFFIAKKQRRVDDTASFCIKLKLVADVRNYSDVTSSLDCFCELSLMLCASTCDSSGKNLGSFGEIFVKLYRVLVIDEFYLVSAEVTNLFLLVVLELLLCILIHDNYLLLLI